MIVLTMIVKNEEHCLARCLRSVKPFIDRAVIVDTGSTDNTQELAADELCGLPTRIHSRRWKDFAANRTEAFQLAQQGATACDYALIIDADEELRPEPGFAWPALTHGVIGMVNTTDQGVQYTRPQLLRLSYDFYWRGVVHEELLCEQAIKGLRLTGATVHGYFDSARNHDPNKSFKDAMTLLQVSPQTARDVFYTAQSWMNAGWLDCAYAAYDKRSRLGGFTEEVWYSLFMMACLLEAKEADYAEVRAAYNRAFTFRRSRAEPLRSLAAYCQKMGDTEQACIVKEMADRIPMTNDQLFVDASAYAS